MTDKVYITLDLFHSAAYSRGVGGSEDYSHDDQYYYLVLQPLLIHGSANAASPRLRKYMDWTGASLQDGTQIELLSKTLADKLKQELASGGSWTATPVPFPHGTELQLKVDWTKAGAIVGFTTINRTLGLGTVPPFGVPMDQWPIFAERNYASLSIKDYQHLRADQLSLYVDWLYALTIELKDRTKKGDELPDTQQYVYDKYIKNAGISELDNTRDKWAAYFTNQSVNPAPAALIYRDLYQQSFAGDTRPNQRPLIAGKTGLRPPQIRYTPEQMRDPLIKDKLFSPERDTYFELIWSDLKALAQTTDDPEEKPSPEDLAAQAFSRLYGFGERLRWPHPANPDDFKHFMIVKMYDEHSGPGKPNPWFITNAHSLAGQVFRIGKINEQEPIESVLLSTLSVQGRSIISDADKTNFSQVFKSLLQEAKTLKQTPRQFSAKLARDRECSNGRVTYLPKNARGQWTGFTEKIGGVDHDVFDLPGSIMDSLTAAGRVEFPKGNWLGWKTPDSPSLVQVNPPRTMLTRDEMFLDSKPLGAQPLVQAKMTLRQLPLAGTEADNKAYELSLASDLHEQDKAQVNECLKRQNTDDSAFIWIMPEKDGEPRKSFSLKGRLIGTEQRAGNTVYLIADDDGKLTALLPQWTGDKGTARQKSMVVQFVCNAIFDEAQKKFERFNWLAQKTAAGNNHLGPFIVLRNYFTNTPSTSAERIFERFTLTLDPAPPLIPDETKPILDHFINFNKLRVGISRNGLEGMQLLTYPDALTPLMPRPTDISDLYEVEFAGGFSAAQAEFWYKLAHSFSQQIGEARPQATPEQVRDDIAATEAMRYLCYVTAGAPWNLTGWVEHQYGYRVPVNGGSAVLPLSTDIRHIANLSYRVEKSETIVPAIFYDHDFDKSTKEELIMLWLNPEYFKKAYSESGFHKPTAKPEELNPARLRPIYEALADLVLGEAALELERWNFNNKLAAPSASPAGILPEEHDTPNITANLQYLESATFRLDKTAHLAPIKKLLEGSFKDFLEKLGDAVNKSDPLWTVMLLKLNDPGWQWSKNLKRSPLFETTNVIRLGLTLTRRSEAVLGKNYLSAKFQPLRPDFNKSGDDLDTSRFTALEKEAKADLALYLTPPPATPAPSPVSPLYQSFEWITSQDLDQKTLLQDPAKDPLRFRKLFGEVLPHLNFPTGLQISVEDVADFFYVLYSFSPLEAHPAFGDQQTTLEFGEFLMLLLDDLARGISTNFVSIKKGKGRPALETALRDRQHAVKLLSGENGGGGIAGKLLKLCFRVDDLKGMENWKDQQEKGLFDDVNKYVNALNQLTTGKRLDDALHSMLAANPALYTYSKAIAAGVFNPDTYSERIYNLQVTKRIRLPQAKANQTTQVDTDRDTFTFLQFQGVGNNRFFLDVLDDASYDNEFEIDQNGYPGDKPIGSRRKASEIAQQAGKYQRGAARARTAEDIIEQQNLLDEEIGHLRQIEVNVVHYNPEWRVRNKTDKKVREWLYLLPSRRFPVIPKPVLPSASAAAVGAESDTPWHTRLQVSFPSEEPTEDFDIDKQFEEKLRDKLKDTVELSGTLASDEPLQLRRIDSALAFPIEKADREGWYHTESYLSLYYFIVEADEEADVSGFRNDAFEIQVQSDPNPFPPPETLQPTQVEFKTPLQRWFNYHRAKHAGGKADPPPHMDTKDALEEIEAWCLNAAAKPELKPIIRDQLVFLPQQVVEDIPDDNVPGFRRAEFAPNATNAGGDPTWTLTVFKNTTATDAIGSVMSAEMFKFLPPPGASVGEEQKRKYLLRVAVLDDPWKFTRVRMRVKRNRTDVDQNHDPDINSQFSMVTKYSDWVRYGRHVIKLNPGDLPLAARFLRIEPDAVKKVVTREQWLNKNSPATQMVSFGPIVERMIKKQFKSKSGAKSLWSDKEAMRAGRQVLGTIVQVLPDNHPRQTATGPALLNSVPERGDQLIKQYLGPVSGAELANLAINIEKKNPVADPALHLMVTWYTLPKSGGTNSPPGDKLLEITWPIRWK